MKKSGMSEQEKLAFDSIISDLFKKNLRGNDKLKEIGDYDGESLFGNSTLFPGCIYAFQYSAMKPSVYQNESVRFEWSDGLPIVLITRVKNNIVSGINLNLCDMSTRCHIINLLHNLDLDFYSSGAEQMAMKGRRPISNNVAKVFLNQETEKAFYEAIKKICQIQYTGFIYRTYSITNIKNPRLIETWQHKYVPFLRYTGHLKGNILQIIWKISGMMNKSV